MKVLFYSMAGNPCGDLIKDYLKTIVPGKDLLLYSVFSEFSRRIQQPREGLRIVIGFLDDSDQLFSLQPLREHLSELRIILVLDEKMESLLLLAHKLHPRHVMILHPGKEAQLIDLKQIIEKMITIEREGQTWQIQKT